MEVDGGGASSEIGAEGGDKAGIGTLRIFVGGLGEGVTDDDLRRMFAALGSVDEIEIIRTKERSMAYLNFTPSSGKSLAKLFSSFNGCVWKGGRLRIEKAKEHYLVKMKKEREQEQEEEFARKVKAEKFCAAATDVINLKKPSKGPDAEKEQLRIFFPKLRKVKPLPFSGSGKHKYSFRNIPVPPLPTHFCDCELHSVPFDAPIGNGINFDAPLGGVDEKEFDLMKSVMNKFISRDENPSLKAECAGSSASDGVLPTPEVALNSEPDEDGIVINISEAVNETDFIWKLVDKTVSENQESKGNRSQALDDKKPSDSNNKQKQKLDKEESNVAINASLKRKKGDFSGVSDLTGESTPLRTQKSKWKEIVGQGSDSSFKLSQVFSISKEADDETETSSNEYAEQDTEEESGNIDESENEAEGSTDESTQLDTEEESSNSEELDDEAEESNAECAQQEKSEEQSSESDENDDEAEYLAEESTGEQPAPLEDSEEVLNESEDRNGLEEAPIDNSDHEPIYDSLGHDEYEVKTTDAEVASVKQEEVKPTDTEVSSVKFTKGSNWSQKMPWTQLVSDLDNSSFSISLILPGNTSENLVAPKPNPNPNPKSNYSGTSQSLREVLREKYLASTTKLTNTTADLHEKKNLDSASDPSGAIKSKDEKPTTTLADSAINQKHDVKTKIYEVSPFVRSASSLKEWTKIKETLRKSRTKKRKVADE